MTGTVASPIKFDTGDAMAVSDQPEIAARSGHDRRWDAPVQRSYHDGWVAATKHRTPWADAPDGPLDQDKWELYHVPEDFQFSNRGGARLLRHCVLN